MDRVFLGFDRPALASSAAWLIERAAPSSRSLDLSEFLVVLPVASAGRRLEEILVQRAVERSLPLVPPDIVTVGALPERLYEAEKPAADEATLKLAWAEAIHQTDRDRLAPFFPVLPEDDDTLAWVAMGEVIERLHVELAAERLDFQQVGARGARLSAFEEHDRWVLLADVQRRWLARLDQLGLGDKHTARKQAIDRRACSTDQRVVLVATVDLNRSQRAMIDLVSERTTALVFAPQAWADRFDAHGCVVCSEWCETGIDLVDEQIEQADDPTSQGDAVIRAIAAYDGRYAPDEITVGVVDEALTSPIEQRLTECNLRSRYGAGVPLSRTPPLRLLSAAAEFLDDRRYPGFAALVRHPDVAAWLDGKFRVDWLSALDAYYADHLPREFDGKWFAQDDHVGTVRKLYASVIELLGELVEPPRPWTEWGNPIAGLLVRAFGDDKKLDTGRENDRQIVEACDAIADSLRKHQQLCSELVPRVSAADAITLTLRALANETIPPRADPKAIELMGWLELVLDDAPALVLAGFNEQFVPSARNGDLFLPNDLRRELGLTDNDRGLARDAYALAALSGSQKDLHVVFGRRNSDGDPLTPSRLLFAADDMTMARRAYQWFKEATPNVRLSLPASLQPGQEHEADFPVPRPKPLGEPVTAMRVTEFRDYLACPYRYYLRHRLKLEALDDSAEELDDAQFGWLVHKAVEVFAKSEAAASQSPEQIEEVLCAKLQELVGQLYGKRPMSAVLVQVEQIRRRLRAFAGWQAEWARQGWQIRFAEEDLKQIENKAWLDVDGQRMTLRGRVDRVDYNEQTHEWAVLDYKTGDSGKSPDETHRRRGDWVDLQLPLYRHLIGPLNLVGIDDPQKLRLGYITIPKSLSQVKVQLAEWTQDDLAAADAQAFAVVRNIRNEVFWPPAETPPAFSEDFAPICHDGQFGMTIAREQEAEVGA